MEAIEFLIELDFDGEGVQKSGIKLNQANRDSVTFNFRIIKGVNEINYSNYTKAEVVFQNTRGASVIDNAQLSSTGISYTLNKYVFGVAGIVLGQINLHKDNTIAATLHYDFLLIRDLANVEQMSQFYIRTIEELIADMEKIIQQKLTDNSAEIQRLLAEFQNKVNGAKTTIDSDLTTLNKLVADAKFIVGDLKANAINVHDDFIEKINALEILVNTEIDDLFTQTENRANEWIEKLREEFERQHEAMEDIVAGDFTTNALFNRHRNNIDDNEQHVIKDGDSFLLPNGLTIMPDSVKKVPVLIVHNLNRYPFIYVLKISDGAGYGGAGETPAGGNNISEFARFSLYDENSIEIYLPEKLINPSLVKVDERTFIINSDIFSYEISLI